MNVNEVFKYLSDNSKDKLQLKVGKNKFLNFEFIHGKNIGFGKEEFPLSQLEFDKTYSYLVKIK